MPQFPKKKKKYLLLKTALHDKCFRLIPFYRIIHKHIVHIYIFSCVCRLMCNHIIGKVKNNNCCPVSSMNTHFIILMTILLKYIFFSHTCTFRMIAFCLHISCQTHWIANTVNTPQLTENDEAIKTTHNQLAISCK